MKINKMRKTKTINSEFVTERESATISGSWRTQRQAKWENLRVESREAFRYVLIGGCWHGRTEEWITRSGESCVIG